MNWTNSRILDIALEQSALDAGCTRCDFLRSENVVVISRVHPKARKYLELPFACHRIFYGNNIVRRLERNFRRQSPPIGPLSSGELL